MKERTLGIVIGAINLVLIVVCVVFFLGKDKTAPVISIGDCDYVYEEDLPVELLYQGITAYDQADGDLTEQIIIEKVVTDRAKGSATITYGVCDSDGNVGKATRTLEMPVLTRIQFPGAGEADNTEVAEAVTNVQDTVEESETADGDVTEEATEETAEDTENGEETEVEVSEETTEETEENVEESETTENEGEDTTGGNVTVVGSNNRRN